MITYTATSPLLLGAISAEAIARSTYPHGLCHRFDVAITVRGS